MADAEALSLPPREAIRYFAGKVDVGTRRWDDVWKAAHSRAFMVAGVQADDVLGGIRGAVQKAIAEGTTLAEFRADLAPLMQRLGWEERRPGYAAWRTRLVYETNLRSAYAAGQYEQQTDPEVLPLVPVWRYRHSGALDPRPEHVRWDGLTLRHDDAWWATHYPPNGWGCGCWVEPLTEAQAARGAGTGGRDGQGLNQAPEILRRRWTDPVSGRTEMVPLGIDPGWDYNVGASWRSLRDLPAPTAPTPPDWPPPVLPIAGGAVPPTRLADADRTLADAQRPWAHALSPPQQAALRQYKLGDGRLMNAVLRGERAPDPAIEDAIADLRSALDQAELPAALATLRGAGRADRAVLRGKGAGDTVSFPWFLSSSLSEDVAAAYAEAAGGPMLEFRLPAGLRRVAYVHPFPEYRYRQWEILASPGLVWRIVERTADRVVLEPARE